MRLRLPTLAIVPILLLGCGSQSRPQDPDIRVSDPWVRAMPLIQDANSSPSNSAIYLTLRNEGAVADRLLGGSTPAAAAVEVHQSTLVEDVMRMERLDGIELPPGSAVELEPGGYHLMLLGLTRSLEEGDQLELTLSLQRSGDLKVTVPVGRTGGR